MPLAKTTMRNLGSTRNSSGSGTLVMVRTTCCETFKRTGCRCSICPNRPENHESVRRYLEEISSSNPLRGRDAVQQADARA